MSRIAGATVEAMTVATIKNKLVDHRDKALQFLSRRHLTELYDRLFPQP